MRVRLLALSAPIPLCAALLCAGAARAQEATPGAPEPAKPAAAAVTEPVKTPRRIKVSGHIDLAGTINPAAPTDGLNYGHLFNDKANAALLNQVALTVERDLDSAADTVNLGFKAQAIYGSDARYTHFLGELDHVTGGLNQVDIVEANARVHLPLGRLGSTDLTIGQYSSPIGLETIDPTNNVFYSHGYIFKFGTPFKHTGVLAQTHLSPVLDIYSGYDTGVNTSVGRGGGSDDGQPHGLFGFGLNLGRLTVEALAHIGAEDPVGTLGPGVPVHDKLRYIADGVVTDKVSDRLTFTTEINYVRDDGARAAGGGLAQYATFKLNGVVTAAARIEVWRDAEGFYVAAFPGNLDYVNAALGRPNGSFGYGPVTYGAVTLGLNIKPPGLPKTIDGVVLRPELRLDRSLGSARPFIDATARGQFTFAIDAIVPLSF